MTTNVAVKRESVVDLFTQVTASIDWGTIDDLYDVVNQDERLVAALLAGDIREQAIKRGIRQLIKKVDGGNGHALYASVKSVDETGREITLYKQETLFNVDDYRQVVDYHEKRARHHSIEQRYYVQQCEKRFGVQIELNLEA